MFEDEYGKSFVDADVLCLSMPALRHNDKAESFIDGKVVTETAQKMAKNRDKSDFTAFCVSGGDEALTRLLPELKSGDVVVIMSNGAFDGVHEKLIAELSK